MWTVTLMLKKGHVLKGRREKPLMIYQKAEKKSYTHIVISKV